MEGKRVLQWLLEEERCKGCGICIALCPRQALGAEEQGKPQMLHREACISCGLCEYWCPDFAIRMMEQEG